jgi:hypothetical protein
MDKNRHEKENVSIRATRKEVNGENCGKHRHEAGRQMGSGANGWPKGHSLSTKVNNKKAPSRLVTGLLKEYGSYLLSRIVVQYHRP